MFQAEQTMPQAQRPAPNVGASLQEIMQAWYPHLFQQTYFLPPIYFNRTQHKEVQVHEKQVLVMQPLSQESDARCDSGNRLVLKSLERLSESEEAAMFVVSERKFGNSLNKKFHNDPDFGSQDKNGDFDILIIHKQFGILIGEIKVVGDLFSGQPLKGNNLQSLIKMVKKGTKQLNKSRGMATNIMKNCPARPRIRTTLMLPNIGRELLREALENTTEVIKVSVFYHIYYYK